MLAVPFDTGAKLRDAAAERLGVSLHGPPQHWGWSADDAFGIEGKRREMAVVFLIDRTFEQFLQKVVDAVLKVYDKYLLSDDLVGYFGLGEGWLFSTQLKGEGDTSEQLREQIVHSVKKAGEPHVYSSIAKCIAHLSSEVDAHYSKWLVVLTDTVDFECANAKGVFDKQAPSRAEAAVASVTEAMQAMCGLNFVIIDAHGIANFNAKHPMWPTWHRMSARLTDE